MTQHSSLKSDEVGTRHRNVLKRYERIKSIQAQEKWGTRESAYKLPKMKLLKIKMKKVKVKAEGEEGAAAPAVAGGTQAPAGKPQSAGGKPQGSAEASQSKAQPKAQGKGPAK